MRTSNARTVLVVLAVAVSGCAGESSTTPTVQPSSTHVLTSSAAGSSAPEATMNVLTLTSPAFTAGGSIPRRFACDGQDVSPALAWTGVPSGIGALVLVVDDPDARGFVHWTVLDLPGADGTLEEGVPPAAGRPAQGRNDFGRPGWGGPCPPSGSHRYVFTLYALRAPLGLSPNADGAAVHAALAGGDVVATAVLEGTYRRGG